MKTLNRILIAATIFLLCGCSFGDPKPQSEDIAALRAIVNLPMEVKSARWEIFGTPDDSGWVPGPTDFHTLIAELEQEQDWFSSLKAGPGNFHCSRSRASLAHQGISRSPEQEQEFDSNSLQPRQLQKICDDGHEVWPRACWRCL